MTREEIIEQIEIVKKLNNEIRQRTEFLLSLSRSEWADILGHKEVEKLLGTAAYLDGSSKQVFVNAEQLQRLVTAKAKEAA